MSHNNTSTRAFKTVNNHLNESRRKVVIAIFVVVALILAAFATLIIGKIVSQLPEKPINPTNGDFTYIPKEGGDVKLGNLLSINDDFKYEIPSDFSKMINLYEAQRKSEYDELTSINNKLTYSLSRVDIVLEADTFTKFNQMVLDYCKSLDNVTSANSNCISNLVVTWGGYSADTVGEYATDVPNFGNGYYDHGLGTTLTLKMFEPSTPITEQILKRNYAWLYENAHKYGFIIRNPESCQNHTGISSDKRIHLRYVGEEHATYIHQNGICFEEYLELLRTKHNSPDKALTVKIGDKSFYIYYVKYTGNPTSVPVFKNADYTISGDNMNGFIVTVEK